MGERGTARAEVVNGEAHAAFAQAQQQRLRALRLAHQHALGQFQRQQLGEQTGLVKRPLDHADDVALTKLGR